MKMSKHFAYVTYGFGLVKINNRKLGYRCTVLAARNLLKSASGTNVYSVLYNNEIIWVSDNEFKENNFIEKTIPRKEFQGSGELLTPENYFDEPKI